MDDQLKLKWDRLEEQAILASERAKPSSAPDFWAKPSCNRCYGRGVVGQITIKVESNTIVNAQLCDCAKKKFVKWRTQFVAKFMSDAKAADSRIDSGVDKSL